MCAVFCSGDARQRRRPVAGAHDSPAWVWPCTVYAGDFDPDFVAGIGYGVRPAFLLYQSSAFRRLTVGVARRMGWDEPRFSTFATGS